MPLEKVYPQGSNHAWDVALHGNIQTIFILLAAAIFGLIITVLNFVSFLTARAVNRVKAVGLRKGKGKANPAYSTIHKRIGHHYLFLHLDQCGHYNRDITNFKFIPISIFLNPIPT